MILFPYWNDCHKHLSFPLKMEGEKMLFVHMDLPAKRSGACPYVHVLKCFQSVFNMQEDKGTVRAHYVDEFKNRISVEYEQVIYRVKGEGILRVIGDYNKEGKVRLERGSWGGAHAFKDETGVEWYSASADFYDPVSKMFTNSLAFAYLMYFWDDVKKEKKHIIELNKFLEAHSQPVIPE